jgi:hypothetical protein
MSKEALKLALEALKDNQHLVADNERHAYVMEYNGIIEKLEEALAKQEQGEPVAWMDVDGNVSDNNDHKFFPIPLYTTTQQRTWVGLTDKEAQWLYDNCRTPANLIDMVEAKLKEKNTNII